jgi:hypothetical protein
MSETLTERTSGLGKVFDDQEFLADARYEVEVYARSVDVTNVGQHVRSMGNVGAGRVDVRILPTSGSIQVDGHKRLTLHLEDGRKLDFFWLRGTATATEGLY